MKGSMPYLPGDKYHANAQGVAIAGETIDKPGADGELISEFLYASSLLLLPVFEPHRLAADFPG